MVLSLVANKFLQSPPNQVLFSVGKLFFTVAYITLLISFKTTNFLRRAGSISIREEETTSTPQSAGPNFRDPMILIQMAYKYHPHNWVLFGRYSHTFFSNNTLHIASMPNTCKHLIINNSSISQSDPKLRETTDTHPRVY